MKKYLKMAVKAVVLYELIGWAWVGLSEACEYERTHRPCTIREIKDGCAEAGIKKCTAWLAEKYGQ